MFDDCTCGTCDYSSQKKEISEGKKPSYVGTCYRYPPKVVVDDKGSFRTQFPRVAPKTHACGEYRPYIHSKTCGLRAVIDVLDELRSSENSTGDAKVSNDNIDKDMLNEDKEEK